MSINIAICLSGEPRHRNRAANSIHNFIKNICIDKEKPKFINIICSNYKIE